MYRCTCGTELKFHQHTGLDYPFAECSECHKQYWLILRLDENGIPYIFVAPFQVAYTGSY